MMAYLCRLCGIEYSGLRFPIDAFEEVEVREHLAQPEHHRCERVVSDRDWQAGFNREAFVQVHQQRAPARQRDAALN